MGEAGARPSLLLYCQHVLGMGHLVRSLALAESLAARFHVVFLNGGPVPHGVPRPRCIDFIDLPPVGFDPAGRLVSRDGRRSVERALDLRRELILTTFHRLRPRAVVVGDMPFLSYQAGVERAVENAGRFLAEGGAAAVKVEGGRRILPALEATPPRSAGGRAGARNPYGKEKAPGATGVALLNVARAGFWSHRSCSLRPPRPERPCVLLPRSAAEPPSA